MKRRGPGRPRKGEVVEKWTKPITYRRPRGRPPNKALAAALERNGGVIESSSSSDEEEEPALKKGEEDQGDQDEELVVVNFEFQSKDVDMQNLYGMQLQIDPDNPDKLNCDLGSIAFQASRDKMHGSYAVFEIDHEQTDCYFVGLTDYGFRVDSQVERSKLGNDSVQALNDAPSASTFRCNRLRLVPITCDADTTGLDNKPTRYKIRKASKLQKLRFEIKDGDAGTEEKAVVIEPEPVKADYKIFMAHRDRHRKKLTGGGALPSLENMLDGNIGQVVKSIEKHRAEENARASISAPKSSDDQKTNSTYKSLKRARLAADDEEEDDDDDDDDDQDKNKNTQYCAL